MGEELYLCYDLKGIQSFIFAVPRVKYISGGSALIDRFDREYAPKLKSADADFLFSGGGKGAFVCKDRAVAETLQKKLVEAAHREGMTICFGCNTDYSEAAHVADHTYPYLPQADHMDGHPCQDSGLYPVSHGVHPIIAKRVFQKGERLDRHFETELNHSPEYCFFHDVDGATEEGRCALAALGNRNRWAIIAMDGNDMGAQHRAAANNGQQTHREWLRKMSTALDDCCRQSCKTAIEDVRDRWRRDVQDNPEEHRVTTSDGVITLPIRPLMVGGDDIVVLCHVRYALEFVRVACRTFEELSSEKAAEAKKSGIDLWPATGGRITLTAGVLFAPISLPLPAALTYTELLLASAKNKGRKHPQGQPAPACVDWESVTEGLIDTPAARRQRELAFYDTELDTCIFLTKRPYKLDELDELETLKQRYSQVPTTIRHQVLPGLRAGYWDRKVFLARLGKRQEALVNDLHEEEKDCARLGGR